MTASVVARPSVHMASRAQARGDDQPSKGGSLEIRPVTTITIRGTIVRHLARVSFGNANTVMASQTRDPRLAAVQIVPMTRLAVLRV